MKIRRTLVGAVAVSGLLAAALAGTAQAADTNTASATALATTGSDTIDEVVGGLSAIPGLDIANYNATGTANINTTANYPAAARTAGADCGNGTTSVTRPNGSSAGKNALSAAIRGAAYGGSANYIECVGIARSSSSGFPTGTNAAPAGTMARIPLALDGLGPAVKSNSTITKRFTLDFLKSVYTRNGAAGSGACLGVVPLVPQANSGTRAFWATAMGVTDYDFSGTSGVVGTPPAGQQTWGSCVTGGAANPLGFGTGVGNGNPGDRIGGATGAPVQEHDGTVLSASNQVVPISVAQNIVMGSQVVSDKRGSSQLASVDFTTVGNPATPATFTPVNANLRHPYALNGGSGASGFTGPRGSLTREVYLFVPHALYDSAYTPPAGATGFAGIPAADKDKFKAEFANGNTSLLCQQSATIALYGLSSLSTCGTPTLN